MNTSRWLAYFECALAMAMGGGVVVAGKFLTSTFPVFLAAGLRLAVAVPILTTMLLVREGRLPKLQAREAGWLFVCSFGGIFMFTVFLLFGLRYTTAAESGIITSTVPIFTTLISVFFLKEKLRGWGVVAVLLTVSGVLVLNVASGDSAWARGPDPWLGNRLIFGCVIGEALFTIAAKLASRRLSALATAAYVNIFGLITFLPFAIYQALHFDFRSPGWTSWSAIVFMGVGISVFQFMIWFSGVSKVSASTAAVFTGVMPVSAVLLSYAVGGERFIWPHLVGMLCVIASIIAVTYGHASARAVDIIPAEGGRDLMDNRTTLMASSPRACLYSCRWVLSLLAVFLLLLRAAPAEAADDAREAEAYSSAWWTGSLLSSQGHTVPLGHTLVEPYLLFSEPLKANSTHSLQSLVVVEAGLADRLELQLVLKGGYQFKGSASSVQLGDTRVRLAFQMLDAENGRWIPDVMFFVKEVFPTGRYDQLNPELQGTDVSGAGAYATAFGVNVQKVVMLPSLHPLRMRLNLNFQVPDRVTFQGPSVYGGSPGATSDVYPGKSFSAVIAVEHHLTRHWVAALDLVYAHAGSDAWVAAAGAGRDPAAAVNPPQDRFTFAPAIEYNFNVDVGIIGGFSVDLGRNVPTAVSPMIAVNIFH